MIKKFLLVIALFSGSLSALYGEESQKIDDILKFNLNLERHSSWLGMGALDGVSIQYDETILLTDKHPLLLSQQKSKKKTNINTKLKAAFLLPEIDTDSLSLSFFCKKKNLATVQLTALGRNSQGEIISSDVLVVNEDEDWCETSRDLYVKNVKSLSFILEAKAVDSTLEQKLWLDKIVIKANEKDIAEYAFTDLSKGFKLKKRAIIPLDFKKKESFSKIPGLGTKKIFAIAESIHGSESITELAIEMMKRRIEDHNCKLILLELPIDAMLAVNRFVLGDERFRLDDIATSLSLSLYSDKLLDFFVWTKEYNQKTEKKVWVLGMDIFSLDPFVSAANTFFYFHTINKEILNSEMETFLFGVLSKPREALTTTLESLEKDENFKKLNDPIELRLIRYNQENIIKKGITLKNLFALRDEIMYENAQYLIKQLCPGNEKVTIYAHLFHAVEDNKNAYNNFVPSMGSLLKKDFHHNYSCVGIFALQGESAFFPTTSLEPTVEPLNSAPVNSLENLLQNVKYDYFYYPVSSLPQSPLRLREGSVNQNSQFNIAFPAEYMQGLVIVKNSKASTIIQKEFSMLDKHKMAQKRYFKFRSLVEKKSLNNKQKIGHQKLKLSIKNNT